MRCEVIIPVGPGHDELYVRAMESVRLATMRKGPFDSVGLRIIADTEGELGRSKARNEGIKQTDADYLFFLDADDVLHPNCFANFTSYNGYDACWGSIQELREGVAFWRYQVPEILNLKQLLAFDPYLTLQMGHFVRTSVARENLFDENLDVGEDWDYYLRMWRNQKCIKADVPFFLNDRSQHSTGPRAGTGRQWRQVVEPMIEAAKEEYDQDRAA